MNNCSVVIIGLPASGKTTYLAALWHLITAGEIDTLLRFGNLRAGRADYLNTIAARWRDAIVQERTALAGNRYVSMNLLDVADQALCVTLPDVPGEAYRRIWEDRDCESEIGDMLRTEGVLLFVHADTIRRPGWIVDEVALSREMGLNAPEGPPTEWTPSVAPTQVQLVDLLQLLRLPPLDIGPRRLAIMLSAWDKVRAERLTPTAYLKARLPLMDQYLRCGADGWHFRVYGLSAQGGDYDEQENADTVPAAEELRRLDQPSMRIQLLGPVPETRDLTEPLAWLMD